MINKRQKKYFRMGTDKGHKDCKRQYGLMLLNSE